MIPSETVEALRERFGKYHVLEKIAQGGMAEVYKVKTVGIAGFEKVQALKRILPHSAREGRFIRSFIDEARIAVELTHRNIVQVFDFGKADGELFMAMELIEGRDLRTAAMQAIACDLLPPIPVSAYIIAEVASGLDYAHRKTDGYGAPLNIVHCDVSPSNVMLSVDGYVKILDFGISRATFSSALERRRLRGKPRYMAPEQTFGEAPTAAADVFALGIIAWELFTGVPLYRGQDIRAILEAVRRLDPPRIDRMNPEVPPEIVDAVDRALSREPSARITAADLAAACTRTAMAGGARELASWLAELDRLAKQPSTAWKSASSFSVPKDTPETPPLRPSTRSLTPFAGRDFGEGTPGPVDATATTVHAIDPHQRFANEPSTTSNHQQWGDRDPTASVPNAQQFGPIETTTAAQRWAPETTTAGVAKLQDAFDQYLPPDESGARLQTATEPVRRYSYEQLVINPGTNPAQLRFDDEATQFVHAAASFDDLQVEQDASSPGVAVDEPIDDDLGVLATGALAERRRTVVVAALLDNAAAEVLRSLARSLSELAYQRGGVVLRQEDESLLVAFGLEVAGEDDVAVAMGFALDAIAMTRDAAWPDAEHGPRLRIGARTGVATFSGRPSSSDGNPRPKRISSTGDIPPVDSTTGDRALASSDGNTHIPGDAIEEARALAREAAPDRPLFVGAAGRMTSGLYTLREVQPTKRIGRRGRVIEVIGPRGFEERDRARLERRGKFVGRTAQLAELEVWFQRAIAADRRLTALVTGAAGTGKSRLVAELVARRTASNSPMRVVMTAVNPASRNAPFALVIDLYQAALGLPPLRGRHARGQVVHRLLHLMKERGVADDRARAVATDLDRAMELRDGIGVVTPEVADLRPRVSAGLAAFRGAMVGDKPLLTVIEDIHLADAASLDVLRHTLAVPARGPELLLLTARPDGPPAPAVDVALQVGDLVGSELRALIVDRLGDAATPLNIAAVIARGGGNPLFVEELAQAVREAGGDVPASARDVVAARVDRLSPKAKTALRFAAVLGGTVRARLLEELLDEESLESEIDELIEAGFLVRAGEGELAFARGLVREVIYDSLPLRAQRENHARIGRLLASRFFAGREEPPAVIAEHMERGGETAAAAAFWLRAGRVALAASDAVSAIAHFTRSLQLERELGAAPPTPTSRARRRGALAGRDDAHRLQGDPEADASDLDELQRLAADDSRLLADVAIRRAQRLLRLGDYAGANLATVAAEDQSIAAGDQRARGEALRVRGEILERLGRFDEALLVVDDARQLFAREGAAADEMAAMVGRGRIHLMRAHYEAARDAYKPVISRIEKTSDPFLERIVQNHVAIIEMCLGNFSLAMTSAQRSLELCRRYGDRAREGDALSVAGIILLEVGMYDAAAARFSEALDLLSRTASRWSRADCLIYAGICDVKRGRLGGIALIDEALAEARRLGARYLEANALISRAAAQLRRNQYMLAVADAAEGVMVARTATLVGYEVQGLARQALALVRLPEGGHLGEAGGLVHRALALLDKQRYLEGSEEEVYAICYDVLRAAGADDRAKVVKARGRAEVERKLAGISDAAWRKTYAAIPEVRALLD